MSATYCFTERQRELFTEAVTCGWVAAWRDYPHFKSHEERAAQALQECEALRSDVCCIQDEAAYQTLVISAWIASYDAVERVVERKQLTEGQIAISAAVLNHGSIEDARRIVRPGFSRDEGQTEIEKSYARYLEAIAARP